MKESSAKLASGGREGLEEGVRTAGPFRPWCLEGGICAHVDQNAPPGYRTSGSAITMLRLYRADWSGRAKSSLACRKSAACGAALANADVTSYRRGVELILHSP